jgi:O-antigen/teichoic acid export membrane protein
LRGGASIWAGIAKRRSGLDVVLNLILMRWFGIAGIALATSLWTVSTFFFLWYWTWKLLRRKSSEEVQEHADA